VSAVQCSAVLQARNTQYYNTVPILQYSTNSSIQYQCFNTVPMLQFSTISSIQYQYVSTVPILQYSTNSSIQYEYFNTVVPASTTQFTVRLLQFQDIRTSSGVLLQYQYFIVSSALLLQYQYLDTHFCYSTSTKYSSSAVHFVNVPVPCTVQ
jgi:hypothetical protein